MFPKSLLLAFVASSLFLANIGVEASPSGKIPTGTNLDHSPGGPTSITIISTVDSPSSASTGIDYFGNCSFPFASYDEIFRHVDGSSALPVQKFLTEAQKFGKCTRSPPTDVHCVEQTEQQFLNIHDMGWWQDQLCIRCSEAGGTNSKDFDCPIKDKDGRYKHVGKMQHVRLGHQQGVDIPLDGTEHGNRMTSSS
ncbi:related to Mig2-2 [Ustilago sp. UG-2017b]|nr:related to Mig2-2 [Ustilago sp. UG-2017b]